MLIFLYRFHIYIFLNRNFNQVFFIGPFRRQHFLIFGTTIGIDFFFFSNAFFGDSFLLSGSFITIALIVQE